MPELPEVETIRRDLARSVEGAVIDKVKVLGDSSVKPAPRSFVQKLKGCQITSLERRAKLLIFNFNKEDLHMLVHLKMTGQLIHAKGKKVLSGEYALGKSENGLIYEQSEGSENRQSPDELPNAWTRVHFSLKDGSQLFFNDIRRFGYLSLVNTKEKDKALSRYGIEPLTDDFTLENFIPLFKGRKTILKAFLLNQELVAGLGNIYVDEVCFFAGVRPTRRVNKVTKNEMAKLHEGCEVIIAGALKQRGTSFSDYRDAGGKKGNNQSFLKTYGRVGKPCVICGEPIVKVKIAGRGTTYCRFCQR